ncbi:MAG TPA: hypothetical protein VEW45_08715 [Candidatus Dormibacteraeota bacterium]|nr:hypothetical protein [Candidatus Dormibacteraeota bacterium]
MQGLDTTAGGGLGWPDDTTERGVIFGPRTEERGGELAISDPDTLDSESLLGRMVTLQAAQLVRN